MKNSTVQPYARPKIKDPSLDPVIAMARARNEKDLMNERNRRQMSGVSGALLHRMHDLKSVRQQIKEIEEGVQEYQDQINLLNERKKDLQKKLVKHNDFCATFDRMIGEIAVCS